VTSVLYVYSLIDMRVLAPRAPRCCYNVIQGHICPAGPETLNTALEALASINRSTAAILLECGLGADSPASRGTWCRNDRGSDRA
jgi:hypothetical protein